MNEVRLIDANALKEEIEKNKEIGLDKNNEPCIEFMQIYQIKNLIDNAPTVTNGTYEQGLRVGAYGRLDEIRPKGEWIKHCPCSSGGWWIRCSECGAIDKSDGSKTINYCWNCGAEMREGDKYD